MFTSRHNARQSKRTNQIIITKKSKTKWSNKSLILKSVQKWSKLPSSIGTFNRKTCVKNVLTEFLLDQRKKVPINRQIGAFKSYFLPMKTNSHNLKIIILITMLINLFNILEHVDI